MVLIDTGPLVALFNKNDYFHQQIKDKLSLSRLQHDRLITTWPVVTETSYLLRTHVCFEAELDFLEWLSLKGIEIFNLTTEHIKNLLKFRLKYGEKILDFADASLLVAAEEIKLNKIFSTDFRDFRVYRIFKNQHFENLMEE